MQLSDGDTGGRDPARAPGTAARSAMPISCSSPPVYEQPQAQRDAVVRRLDALLLPAMIP